jgi:hypothetical protein
MIMSLEIVNTETATVIVPRALRVKGLTEVQRWPGTDFVVGSDDEAEAGAALALIGKLFSHLPILLPYTFISGNGQSLTLRFARFAKRVGCRLLTSPAQATTWRCELHLQGQDIQE